jgi:outer membrane protein assembly factor BamD (BamD/ComL family)
MKKQIENHLLLINTAMKKLIQSNTKETALEYGEAIENLRKFLEKNPEFPEVEGLEMYLRGVVKFRNEAFNEYRAFGWLTRKPFSEWLVKEYAGQRAWTSLLECH